MARYKKDGLEFPSVTEIIGDATDKSGALTQWAANMTVKYIREYALCDDDYGHYEMSDEMLDDARSNFLNVSKEALSVGSIVHDHIEKYLKNGDESYMDLEGDAFNAFTAFVEWTEKNEIKPVKLEHVIYSDYWAGMLDFLGMYNGKLYVIDWKTSKAFYPEMRYQVAAYRSVAKMEPFEVEGCGILRLDKETGEPFFKDTSKTYEKDLLIFNKMLELYLYRHPIIAKKAGFDPPF